MTAPIASGWSGCRVGFSPLEKRRLCTAHTQLGHPTDTAGVKLRAQSGFFASDHSNECSDTQDKRKSQRSCYRALTDTNPISI
jgi:hypothetical protein